MFALFGLEPIILPARDFLDAPGHRLRRCDLATIIDFHHGVPEQKPSYSLKVFNAIGDTVAVIALGESQIETMREDKILCARVLAA